MATSISSECAFSSSAITITKHHNHLNGDIVEALQCFKCLIWQDLLFRKAHNPSILSEVADKDSEDVVFKLLQSDEATTGAQGLTLDWKLDELEDEFEDEAMDLFSFEWFLLFLVVV